MYKEYVIFLNFAGCKKLKQIQLHKTRFESRDEVQLPFAAQGVAANKCDASNPEASGS